MWQIDNENTNTFIHGFVHFTHDYHALETCLIWINMLIDEIWIYEWTNVMWISHLPINLCVKCVFNGRYQCVKHMNYEWTNFAWFLLLSREMLSLWWRNRRQLIWHHVCFVICLFRNLCVCFHVCDFVDFYNVRVNLVTHDMFCNNSCCV
jgi:hypothetical protein